MAPKSKNELSPSLHDESDVEPAPAVVAPAQWVRQEVKVDPVQTQIVWRNVIFFGALHLASVYALFLLPTAKPMTWLFSK